MGTGQYFLPIKKYTALLMSAHRFEHELWFDENGVKNCFSVFAQGVSEGLWQQDCLSNSALAKQKIKRNVGDFYLELIFVFFSGLGLVSQILLQYKMSLNNISEFVFYFLYQ